MEKRKCIFILAMLLLSMQLALAQSGMKQYEYWIDDAYEFRIVKAETQNDVTFTLPLTELCSGIHYLNFRILGDNGEWGGLSRFIFYVPEGKAVCYEYWLDDQYENRTTITAATVSAPFMVDISHLNPGIHYLTFRTLGSKGIWGGLSRYMFYLAENMMDRKRLASIEYCIDNDAAFTASIPVTDDTAVATIDITDLPKGDHNFFVFGRTKDGNVCMFETLYFRTEHLPVVPAPEISHEGNVITIKSGEGSDTKYPVEFFYTLDDSKPSRHSIQYENPFHVVRNCTVKAIARQYAHEDSEVAELKVNWFKVATPTFAQHGKMLTIQSDTAKAALYYKIGNGEEMLYDGPIRLANQSWVTAIGRYEGYFDSESVVYQPRPVKSGKPAVVYDGRNLQLTSAEEGVNFYYTLDDSSPVNGLDVAESAQPYLGKMRLDRLCTLRAVAIIDSMNVSDVQEFPIKYLYDGETAYVTQSGVLRNAFEWCDGTATNERLAVVGPLNNDDISLLAKMQVLRHLDMSQSTITSHQLPADGLAGTPLISFVSPKDLNDVGGQLFADCPQLASVVWNADVALKSNTFEGVDNPNLLLYVNDKTLNGTSVTNVVEKGRADKITLTDVTTGNCNFYCPMEFIATDISFTHDYQQETVIGKTQGWETLTLPFDVQKITHQSGRTLHPFGADGDGYPFWLMELADGGLQNTQTIEAYKPYIISMPNSPNVYADEYNQQGKVTFSAQNAVVSVTNPQEVKSGFNTLIPTYQTVERSPYVFALNVGDARNGYLAGSAFLPDYRDVRPFEVYMPNTPSVSQSAIALSALMNIDAGIYDIPTRDYLGAEVKVYNLSGFLVKKGKRDDVMKSLPKGIYIVNGRKVVMK